MHEMWVWPLGWEDSPGGGNGSPLQYSCPGESHEQRNLVGSRPWGCKELGTAEHLNNKKKNESLVISNICWVNLLWKQQWTFLDYYRLGAVWACVTASPPDFSSSFCGRFWNDCPCCAETEAPKVINLPSTTLSYLTIIADAFVSCWKAACKAFHSNDTVDHKSGLYPSEDKAKWLRGRHFPSKTQSTSSYHCPLSASIH